MWRLDGVLTLEHNSKQALREYCELASRVSLGSPCALLDGSVPRALIRALIT